MKYKNSLVCAGLLAAPLFAFASPATDRQIEADSQASFDYRMILLNHVHVTAADGVVTLIGTVQDQAGKDLAEATVARLPGVTRVINQTTIRPAFVRRSDARIAYDVRNRLIVRTEFSPTVTVEAHWGVVTLSGTAATAAQKELAGADARAVDRVKSVRNEIVVRDPAVTAEMPAEPPIDDASVATQVENALRDDPATHAVHAEVAAAAGEIVITGEAGSNAQKSLVTKVASEVRGGKSVRNEMAVRSVVIN